MTREGIILRLEPLIIADYIPNCVESLKNVIRADFGKAPF